MDRDKLFLLLINDATLLLKFLNKRKRDEDEAKMDDDNQKQLKKKDDDDDDKPKTEEDTDDEDDDDDDDDDDGDTILSYKGIVLTKFDEKILKGPYFLNDTIIEFYFRYLASIYGEEDVLFVAPSVSFWLANSDSHVNLEETKDSLKLNQKQIIFFTINNNVINSSSDSTMNNAADGGTHWSLLVYYRAKNLFVHQDSVRGLNKFHAELLYSVLKEVLDDNANNLRPPIFIELAIRTPKQSNYYDCGLYVMKIAEVILEWYLIWRDDEELGELWFDEVSEKVSRFYVEGHMRTEIRMLIRMLREDEEGASGSDTG